MNRKGPEITVATILVLVLSFIVLIVLGVGFTQGWLPALPEKKLSLQELMTENNLNILCNGQNITRNGKNSEVTIINELGKEGCAVCSTLTINEGKPSEQIISCFKLIIVEKQHYVNNLKKIKKQYLDDISGENSE